MSAIAWMDHTESDKRRMLAVFISVVPGMASPVEFFDPSNLEPERLLAMPAV
ncbi:MAG: hypothetical protein AMXMBFR46_24030 [Acidimicrobiia bacterium]